MAVLYVDLEHERVVADPELGPAHRARFEEARGRLADAAGVACERVRAGDVRPGLIAERAPTAIVLSGCTTDWADYDLGAWGGLLDVIRRAETPMLGICGGHQLIGYAHGAAWGPLGPLGESEPDPDPRFAPGQRKQRGFLPVAVDTGSPLFEGLGPTETVFQSHYWQLLETPAGFATRASSAWSPIQAIERLDRPVFGIQFHAERFDAAHPAGARVLRRFFAAVRSRPPGGPSS